MSKINPAAGVADFWSEFTRPNPYRWPILGASVMMTVGLLYAITQERVLIPPERPKVTYITSFADGRSDTEIAESNRRNQQLQDERRAEAERRAERSKELYRTLGRATGLDVDAMERQIAEDEAREQAAADARRAEVMGATQGDTGADTAE